MFDPVLPCRCTQPALMISSLFELHRGLHSRVLKRSYLRPAVGAVVVAFAFLLRLMLVRYFSVELPPFLTFYPAVMVVALVAGLWAGLLATVMASLMADYWIFTPVGHFSIARTPDILSLIFFFAMGVFISLICERYRRSFQSVADYRKQQDLWETQEKLRQKEEHFEALANAIQQLTWMADPDGSVSWYNQRWYDYTGIPPEQAKGWGWRAAHDPETLPKVLEKWKASIASGEPFDMIYPLRRADGAFTTFLSRAVPVKDRDGKVVRWFGTSTDITEQRSTEEGLRASEAKLHAVIASAMDAMISVDEQQRIVVFNHAAEAVFQCPASEAIGSTIDRFIPASLRNLHREHMRRFGNAGVTARSMSSPGILTAVRSNGQEFPIEATISQVRIGGQKLYTVILRDITERKQAEEALHQSEAQFRALADAIPQLCWMATADGSIFWYNERWYEYTGTIPELMQGWGWQAVHDPETLPAVLARWKVTIATGEPFDMVFPLRGADGTFRPFLTRVRPVRDAAGNVVRWFGTNTDISEQKEIELELRKSKARLDLAVEVASLGEWDLNLAADTGSRSSRHAEIFGYPPTDHHWSFSTFLNHLLPQNRVEVEAKVKTAQIVGTWDFETQIRRLDGEVRWIWARGRSMLDDTGQPTRAYGTVMDITDRKMAEQALLRSEKLASVGRMAASIAHEINNPLEATTNALFIAMTVENLPESAREYLEMADAELKRIAHITRQSLGFYRESNAPALVAMTSVLESAIELLKSKISKKRAIIEKQWRDNVEIIAIAGELRQVFSNLLVNSLDAMDEEGGTIKVRVSSGTVLKDGRRYVRVTIADNGKGIPANSRAHLFEPFYTTKGTVGTGLGLWVSKQIIDKHDGSIRVRSCTGQSNSGTVFSILLPAESAALATTSS